MKLLVMFGFLIPVFRTYLKQITAGRSALIEGGEKLVGTFREHAVGWDISPFAPLPGLHFLFLNLGVMT